MDSNIEVLQNYINSSPCYREAEYNYTELRSFISDGEDVRVSRDLQEILSFGFFQRLQIVILNLFCMSDSVAQIVSNFAKKYFYQLNYREPVLAMGGAYVFFHERGRPIQVFNLPDAQAKVSQVLSELKYKYPEANFRVYFKSPDYSGSHELGPDVNKSLENYFR